MLLRKIILIIFLGLTSTIFIGAGSCDSNSPNPANDNPDQNVPPAPNDNRDNPLNPNDNITPPITDNNAITTPSGDQSTTQKSTKACDTLHPLPLVTDSSLLLTKPPCCPKPYEDILSFIITGQGNTWVDDTRKWVSADLESDGKKANELIAPLVTQAGHKSRGISLPGVVKKGSEDGNHSRLLKNTEATDKAMQEFANEIDPNKKTLVIIGMMDHGSSNGSTGISYADLMAIAVKYIHGCVDLVFVIGGCESSGVASRDTLENAVQTLGSEYLAPYKARYRKEHPEYEGQEIPREAYKEMLDKVYLQMPRVCSISVHYSARVREGGLPGESNINYCDGGFFVAWYRGFVDAVNKAGGGLPIKQSTLAEAFNAADAHNTNADQHPGVSAVDWNGAVDHAFDKK